MNARPKHGVPVLVCLSLPSKPVCVQCYMRVFQTDESRLSLALYVSVGLSGVQEPQTCVLQYDADGLNRTATALMSGVVDLTDRLAEVARHADPAPTTLTLTLNRPPPVWCPRAHALSPQPTSESASAFTALAALAKATTLQIVFDAKWLTNETQAGLQRLVRGKVSLRGCVLDKYFKSQWEVRDWTAFAPSSPTLAPASVKVEAVAATKRPRPGKS